MTTWLDEEMEKQGLLLYALPDREVILKAKLRKFASEIVGKIVPKHISNETSILYGSITEDKGFNICRNKILKNAKQAGIELEGE